MHVTLEAFFVLKFALCGSAGALISEYLYPAVPAQLCGMSDTRSTVLVSGSQSAEHHCLLAKIVPILVWLLLLYLLWAAFCDRFRA